MIGEFTFFLLHILTLSSKMWFPCRNSANKEKLGSHYPFYVLKINFAEIWSKYATVI